MSRINWGRVLLGGLAAGLVLNVFDVIINAVWLMDEFEAAMQALGKGPMPGWVIGLFVVWDFVMGIFIVWLYAAIRPRFGPGPRTAVIAGLATWFVIFFMNSVGQAPLELFPMGLYVSWTLAGVIQYAVAGLAGAWLYVEGAGGLRQAEEPAAGPHY